MLETNGKGTEEKMDLRDVLGIREKNPFVAKNEKDLKELLSEMWLVDLQKMAIKCGVSASGTVPSLRKKIMKAFSDFSSRNKMINSDDYVLGNNTKDSFSKEQREDVERLLNVAN
jgi:hypothetical protein